MNPGSRPGFHPGFAGVTLQTNYYEIILWMGLSRLVNKMSGVNNQLILFSGHAWLLQESIASSSR
jgi:hypothetical protein